MSFHTMIDLETLGHKPNAYIIAIGAVNFGFVFGMDSVVSTFYRSIKLVPDDRFSIDPQTVGWWLSQSKEAQNVLNNDESVHIHQALKDLAEFIHGSQGVWGNGATFDNIILREAFKQCGIACPWHFRKDKCYRTVINLFPKEDLERVGEHHNALDDALTQTKHLIKLCKKYGIYQEEDN